MLSLFHRAVDLATALPGRASPLFADGWGDEDLFAWVARTSVPLLPAAAIVELAWQHRAVTRGIERCRATFPSPRAALPADVATGHLLRLRAVDSPGRAACVVLAASREEGFALREALYRALCREGIDLVFLENPYYGARRPPGQRGAALRTVADHLNMNLATVEEARAVLAALRRSGYERLGVAGYSMGGYIAAMTAAVTPEPLAIAALAAGASPVPVFTRLLLSRSIDFARLGGSPEQAEAARHKLAAIFEVACVTRLPAPPYPQGAVLVGCLHDGYVPASETFALHAHWPGSELRWVDAGHVSAMLIQRAALRRAVLDAFARLPAT